MNKKVSELNEATQVNDNDFLMILQDGENKKIPVSKLIPIKSFIDVTISENFVNPSAAAYNPINFDKVVTSRGNQLTLENGKIKIGPGINFVEVSGKIQVTAGGNATGGKNIIIRQNNVYKERLMYYTDAVRNIDKEIVSKPIEVKEGDTIDVLYYGAANDVISNGEIFTHLYVKAI